MAWMIMVSTLSGENLSLCREREWERPKFVALRSSGVRFGMREDKCSRMARWISSVDLSVIGFTERPGIFAIALASFASATASDAFFSSLRESRKDDSSGVTLPSPRAAASSSADAAFSNF